MAKQYRLTDRIGVHFNLTEGLPLTIGIMSIPLFVKDGAFHRAFLRQPRELNEAERQAVFAELCAQAERIRRAGVAITHADSHHYLHTYRALAPIFAAVCHHCGINSIRLNRTLDTSAHPCVTDGRIDNTFWREQGLQARARGARGLRGGGGADRPHRRGRRLSERHGFGWSNLSGKVAHLMSLSRTGNVKRSEAYASGLCHLPMILSTDPIDTIVL